MLLFIHNSMLAICVYEDVMCVYSEHKSQHGCATEPAFVTAQVPDVLHCLHECQQWQLHVGLNSIAGRVCSKLCSTISVERACFQLVCIEANTGVAEAAQQAVEYVNIMPTLLLQRACVNGTIHKLRSCHDLYSNGGNRRWLG